MLKAYPKGTKNSTFHAAHSKAFLFRREWKAHFQHGPPSSARDSPHLPAILLSPSAQPFLVSAPSFSPVYSLCLQLSLPKDLFDSFSQISLQCLLTRKAFPDHTKWTRSLPTWVSGFQIPVSWFTFLHNTHHHHADWVVTYCLVALTKTSDPWSQGFYMFVFPFFLLYYWT